MFSRISIHAPRTGSDIATRTLGVFLPISIHAPRTGSDRRFVDPNKTGSEFQSTLPARGATKSLSALQRADVIFQSTLPARGATVIFDIILRVP